MGTRYPFIMILTNDPCEQALVLPPIDPPKSREDWPRFRTRKDARKEDAFDALTQADVKTYSRNRLWIWPDRDILFLCDLHADRDAFIRSLVWSGGVTLASDGQLALTELGRSALFVIGGDLFDKGPRNLPLLRALSDLISLGADVKLLAGNHDVRALLGLGSMGKEDTRHEHLLVRMGKKAVPLFKEILTDYDVSGYMMADADDETLRRHVYPAADWFDRFAVIARGIMPPKKLEKELKRMREKLIEFEESLDDAGITLPLLVAAVRKAEELFLSRTGEFSWLYEKLTLAHQEGSFLFVHAGVDDAVAEKIRSSGVESINAEFRNLLREDMFELYFGPLGNAFRTKYRDIDLPFGPAGMADLRAAGIYAIVHGHDNQLEGQQLRVKAGLLNFECDASVDRGTRKLFGLDGPGAACLRILKSGVIEGLSTDYPAVRTFRASRSLAFCLFRGVTPSKHRSHLSMSNPSDASKEPENETTDEQVFAEESQEKAVSKIKFESTLDREAAASYLSALVDGIRSGSLMFRKGEDSLSLSVGPHVEIEVKASKKEGKEKVEMTFNWSLPSDEDLSITAD